MVCVCVYTEANLYNCVQVMPVNHIDVLREEAYMLFYVRHPKLAVRIMLFSWSIIYDHSTSFFLSFC